MISYQKLKKSPLFRGIQEKDTMAVLSCLAPSQKKYKKGEDDLPRRRSSAGPRLYSPGKCIDGKRGFLGETVPYWNTSGKATSSENPSPVSARNPLSTRSLQKTAIFSFSASDRFSPAARLSVLFISSSSAIFWRSSRKKNTIIARKADLMSKRTVREKLLAYLSAQAQLCGSSSFQIPLKRQQLADYLAVDRSHMTVELKKLEKEGILCFRRNSFRLL